MNKLLLLLTVSISLTLFSCISNDDGPCGPTWKKNTQYYYGDIVTYRNYCWRAYRENINVGPGSDSNYVWFEYVEVEDDSYSSGSCYDDCDNYCDWDCDCDCH